MHNAQCAYHNLRQRHLMVRLHHDVQDEEVCLRMVLHTMSIDDVVDSSNKAKCDSNLVRKYKSYENETICACRLYLA